MTILNKIACCAVGLIVTATVMAEDVKMFSDRTPSAEEMGELLFSKQPDSTPANIKMRSISFGKSKSTPKELPELAGKNQATAIVGLPIKFAYNSAEVMEESKPFLNEIGKMLALPEYTGEKLIIEGHTDAAGSESYNKQLSKKRAQAVKDYLKEKFNVPANRLLVTGVGESQALPNSSPYSALNRRVQFRKAP